MAWLLVGVAAFLVGAVWLLALTQTIVLPVVAATIIAAVLSPVMGWLERHRVGRGLGTAIVLVGLVVLGVLVVVVVVAGISSETDDLTANLRVPRTRSRAGSRTWAYAKARPRPPRRMRARRSATPCTP